MAEDTEGQGKIETVDPQPSNVVDVNARTEEPEPDAETVVDADDVDAQALADAEAAVAAEDKVDDPPADPDPEPVADPPADPEPDPKADTPDPEPEPDPDPEPDPAADAADAIQVPKGRLDEVSRQRDDNAAERDKALQTAAYWKGRADAQAAPQPGDPGAQPKLTVAEQIQTLRQEEIALTTQFDEGALSLTDVTTRQHAIQDQIASLREVPQAAPAQGDDAYMGVEKARLVDAHPYIAKLTNAGIEYLESVVLEQAKADGRPIGTGDAELMRFRTEVAKLSDTLGPGMLGEQPSAPTPPSGGEKEPTPEEELAAARRRKLGEAANAPPDTSQLGSNNDSTADLLQDADRLSNMTPEELEELPMPLLEKALAS